MRQEAIELIVALKGHTLPKGAKNAYNRLCKAIEQASSVSSIQSDKTSDAEKQEPFAYLDPGLGAFYWAREYPDGPPPGFEPVYLAGSNKRWVGLTDAEIEEFDYDFRDLVMDIEKLLMERNS